MKHATLVVAGLVGFAGLAGPAAAQDLTLSPGQLEYSIVADRDVADPANPLVRMALQVRYVGGDVRVASLGATRGRIVSNEPDSVGVLARDSVRQAPFGNDDFGALARQGMTDSHRELFAGGAANNNADQNGGDPAASTLGNPHNGGGEFRYTPGFAGFGNILAFDNALSGIGRGDSSGDGALLSVGLIDDNNGGGDDSGIEPTAGQSADTSRWDTIFLFNYTVTSFYFRTVVFEYQPLGTAENPGVGEDTVQWWNASLGGFRGSNAAAGVFRRDLSDTVVVRIPAPGGAALLGVGGVLAGRRRRRA